jgi:hypothetical protein
MAAGYRVGAAPVSAESANGHGELFAEQPGTALRTAKEPERGPAAGQYHTEAETGFQAASDTEQPEPHSPSSGTSGYILNPEQAYAVALNAVADADYPRPAHADPPANAPNGLSNVRRPFFRRVATPQTVRLRQHHDVAEPTSDTAGSPVDKATTTEGISAFFGRLLNQLSLSAWLPAAMLVGSLAVLLQLRAQRNRNIVEAVTSLANRPLGLLVLLLFAIVLATMVTQAFEFEVIRLLEGYWGSGIIMSGISHLFVGRQRRKFRRLLGRRDKLTLRAFDKARLLEDHIVPADKKYIVDLIKGDLEGNEDALASGWRARKRLREAMSFDWRQFAPADLMGRLEAVEGQIDEYPRPHRMLPTKLGNVLRAVEDSISSPQEEDLEGFVIRHWDDTPSALRKEHDQYRNRLDLYCTLVFVFLVLAILAPLLVTLGTRYLPSTIAISSAYLVMSFVSYTAAIASARGYGLVLRAIAKSNHPVKVRHRHWRPNLNVGRIKA